MNSAHDLGGMHGFGPINPEPEAEEPVFHADDDYRFYLEKLKHACDRCQCDVHAYVLMTNHVHLLITPHTENGLSKAIQMLGRYYVQYFNHKAGGNLRKCSWLHRGDHIS